MNSIKDKDLLFLGELSREEIIKIIDLADKFKEERRKGIYKKHLENKTLALLFEKPSTRTRISFEVAMRELGGNAISLSFNEIQLSRGETIGDTAKTLSQYVDIIMSRVNNHNDLLELAKYASVPVINGLSDIYHPVQVLADLQTIREKKHRFEGLKLAWIGDGNNICNTLLIGCSKMGINMITASPEDYEPNSKVFHFAKKEAKKTGTEITLVNEPEKAVKDADIVVTDTFVSMGSENEREERIKKFIPNYQINHKLMRLAKTDAIFMHCLPAHRGEEVTGEIIDGPKSVVWDEAENRLHSQKALLCLLLLKDENLRDKII